GRAPVPPLPPRRLGRDRGGALDPVGVGFGPVMTRAVDLNDVGASPGSPPRADLARGGTLPSGRHAPTSWIRLVGMPPTGRRPDSLIRSAPIGYDRDRTSQAQGRKGRPRMDHLEKTFLGLFERLRDDLREESGIGLTLRAEGQDLTLRIRSRMDTGDEKQPF